MVSKSEEKPSIFNTPCSVEDIVFHLEATELFVAINTVAPLKHYLILDLKFVIIY